MGYQVVKTWDQPAILTLLPSVTLGFRQFGLGLACVEIAVCAPTYISYNFKFDLRETRHRNGVVIFAKKLSYANIHT